MTKDVDEQASSAATAPSEDVEPRETDHPTGAAQAAENAAEESPS